MSEAAAVRWVRLQDGQRLVGNLWPASGERQRRETLFSALMSGTVRMRARYAAKPKHPDGRPMLPTLERDGTLGMATPLPDVQVFLRMDPRLVTWDFRGGRIVISPVYDDRRFWGVFDFEPHFPGGTTIATGRFLSIELDDVEFDGAAACAYISENLLPTHAAPSDTEGSDPEPISGAGNVTSFPYRTGAAGRPTSWHLFEAECRRRYEAGERHPNGRTGIESPSEWARVLSAWLKEQHRGAAPAKEKTLTNHLAPLLRQLTAGAPTPAS